MKKLSEAEFEIMTAVWSLGESAATPAVGAALNREPPWAPQTIMTMLTRLEAKGFVHSEKRGKERVFTAAVTEAEYLRFESGHFLETVHRNDLLGMMNALYDGDAIGDDDINALKRWLNERE